MDVITLLGRGYGYSVLDSRRLCTSIHPPSALFETEINGRRRKKITGRERGFTVFSMVSKHAEEELE